MTSPPAAAVVLRDAAVEDIPALARLHVRTFEETHGRGPDAATREKQWHAKFASGALVFCIVLDVRGALVGFAAGQLHRDAPREFDGELNKIYVLRDHQRRGLGKQLLCASAQRFLTHNVRSMLLFGDARSPSNGFYEAMGAQRLFAPTGEFHGAYGWPDLSRVAGMCAQAHGTSFPPTV